MGRRKSYRRRTRTKNQATLFGGKRRKKPKTRRRKR